MYQSVASLTSRKPWHRTLPASHYVLLSLLFFVGLELISAFHQWIVVPSIVLIALTFYGIVLVRIEERGQFRALQTILPTLAATGLAGFALFIPRSSFFHLYCAVAAILLYVLLKHGAKQAYPTWNWALSTVVYFLNIAVILGLRYHIFSPVILTISLVFVVSFLISMQALRRATSAALPSVLLALSVALALTQLAWVLQFLPTHYMIQSGILVVAYYSIFHLLSISFERQLRRRDFAEYAVVGLTALLLLLVSAR